MSVTVLNTDAGLSGKTLINAEDAQNVTGAKSFNRSPNPPFVVQAGSANVPNLDADKLDGLDSLAFVKADGTVAMTGALTMTAGQIVFPATQVPSAGVNTLDDYEEGTWTPGLTGSGGGSGQVYGVQTGKYVKIGRRVEIYGRITLTTLGTVTTSAQLTGLPFTSDSGTNQFGGIIFSFFQALTSNLIWIGGFIPPSVTTITIQCKKTATTATENLLQADLSNTSDFTFWGSYMASA